jgi:sigma-54 dependent transcriptional regulator, acetoin dehydrogenase operon transcriptional activator AcoR
MPSKTHPRSGAPRQLFFHTPAQRALLARHQLFEDGVRPSGLVNDTVVQSWLRCCSARLRPEEAVAFDPVSASRRIATLQRHRELIEAAREDLDSMEASLSGTACRVLLTDPQGVVVHATERPAPAGLRLLQTVSRVGINVSENQVGTTAPGIVMATGRASSVMGPEHFFECLQSLHCAAAPIHDVHGQLAAVLDLTVEGERFDFDATALVGLYAASIENRLLQVQSRDHLVLRFQSSPRLLGTPLEAMIGMSSDGRVAWSNPAAIQLLGTPCTAGSEAETALGLDWRALQALSRSASAQPLRLPNGLGVWVRAQLQARNGVDFQHAVSVPDRSARLGADAGHEPEAPRLATGPGTADTGSQGVADPTQPRRAERTLNDHSRQVIEATLASCEGNIARAARTLGVSRGLLYRRLRSA